MALYKIPGESSPLSSTGERLPYKQGTGVRIPQWVLDAHSPGGSNANCECASFMVFETEVVKVLACEASYERVQVPSITLGLLAAL